MTKPAATYECRDCANQFDAAVRPETCPGCGSPIGMFRVSIDPDDDMCMCGHLRASHFMVRNRRGPFTESCCDVVIRGDGTGCPCRGFRLDTGRQKGDDDGVEYSDPRDARADRWS